MENDKLVRLIDCAALREKFQRRLDASNQGMLSEAYYSACLELIDEAPAVDAVEVVHAYWIDIKGTDGKDYLMCSNCHHGQEITGVKNYCAVCGARMDGRREEEHNAAD